MLKYLQATQTKKRSAERDRLAAKRLHPAFTGRCLQEIRAADIRKYIDRRKAEGAKPATVNKMGIRQMEGQAYPVNQDGVSVNVQGGGH